MRKVTVGRTPAFYQRFARMPAAACRVERSAAFLRGVAACDVPACVMRARGFSREAFRAFMMRGKHCGRKHI